MTELSPTAVSEERDDSFVARMKWVAYPVAVFAASRAGILFVTYWSLTLDPRLHRGSGPVPHPAIHGLCWWDCAWYERIAIDGYQQALWTNFFPLFPLIGRAVHSVTGMSVQSALVLAANLISLAALIVIFRLFSELAGEPSARSALALMVAWPFAFFQAAGYPESLMTLTTAAATLLAIRRRHLSAGLVLGLGILGRHLTVVGGLALLAQQLRERGRDPRKLLFHPAILGLLLPFAVAGVYIVFQWQRFGDPLAFWHARTEGWGQEAWFGLYQFFTRETAPTIHSYVWLSLIPGVGAFLLWTRKEWWTLGAFGLGLMLVLWTIGLMGLGRYTGSCWPAFLPLGALLARHSWLQTPALIASAVLQGMYLYLFSHAFPIN